jgi:hypothetical protein
MMSSTDPVATTACTGGPVFGREGNERIEVPTAGDTGGGGAQRQTWRRLCRRSWRHETAARASASVTKRWAALS